MKYWPQLLLILLLAGPAYLQITRSTDAYKEQETSGFEYALEAGIGFLYFVLALFTATRCGALSVWGV